jgi:CHAD domain-containing protein
MPEREVKLTPAAGFRLPSLTGVAEGVVARPDEILELRADYYDTPDLRLARAGASLRYRPPDGWTVKLPNTGDGAMLVRSEHNFSGEPGTVPDDAVDLVRAYVRTATVRVIAHLKTRRRRIDLVDASGEKVAEVVDDEVSVLDDGRIVNRFRELEVELSEDAPVALADAVVARLERAGAGSSDPTPKIVRSLGMRAVAGAAVAPPGKLSRSSPTRDVVRAAIRTSVLRLLDHEAGVRLGGDPESVHQARVATRRLRSDLRTFRSLLVPDWDEALRAELKWLGGELGAVRDTEVLLDLLHHQVDRLTPGDHAVGERLLGQLVDQREEQRAELLEAMRSERYAKLLERLVAAANAPALLPDADAPATEVLPALVDKPWKKLRRDVRALDDVPPDEDLHHVRIRAKRARYAAEAVSPALGKRTRRFAKAVAKLQDVLGDHQDAVVAGAWLRAAAKRTDDLQEVFVAGVLTGMIRAVEHDTRAAWPRAWKQVRKARLRS